jgi:hypothetical protein
MTDIKLEQLKSQIITIDLNYINLDQIHGENNNAKEFEFFETVEIENKSKKGYCFPLCFMPEILLCLTCISGGICGLIGLIGSAILFIGGLLATLAAVIVPIIG